MHENDAYDYFCYKLFENKNNQMIIKTNLRHIYSNVHLGFNIWEKILDNNIYHIIIYYIAKTMEKYIIENTTIQERDEKKLGDISYYIQINLIMKLHRVCLFLKALGHTTAGTILLIKSNCFNSLEVI